MFNFDENTFSTEHDGVIAELRNFENGIPFQLPPRYVVIINANQVDIPYGAYGSQEGTIHMQRGNYQITGHTPFNGVLTNLPNYNYSTDKNKILVSINDIRSAFMNRTMSQVFIVILSECSRSALITSTVQKLVSNPHKSLTDIQKSGLWEAINTYGQVALSTPTRPLTTESYTTFFNTRQTTQTTTTVNPASAITALDNLIII